MPWTLLRSRFLFLRRALRFGDGPGVWVAVAFAVVSCALLVRAVADLPLVESRGSTTLRVEPSRILHEDRHGYLIPIILAGSDSNSWPNYSSLEVLEDGRPLGPPHSSHEEIRARGGGRYSHWTTGVYLSSSDDSDPRSNGRNYALRYFDRAPAPEPVRHPVAVLVSVTFVSAILLNAGRALRMTNWIASAFPSWTAKAFASALTGILIIAALSRLVWVRAIQLPGVSPDSQGYLDPALEHPWFPLSDVRPISVPYLISVSLGVFRHPVGILVAHAGLALLSAALLAVAFRRRFGTPFTALLVAIYVLFSAKNVILEHLLLSDHLARCLYLLFLAILIGFWKARSNGLTVLLALLSVAAILTKPSAVILLPVFLGWLLLVGHPAEPGGRRRLIQSAGVYLGVVGCLLAAYVCAIRVRFGFFGLSGMSGYVFYWHVHPLTRMDAGIYPEIKAEMKPSFQKYLEDHRERGDYDGDWVVWGRGDPTSPAAIVSSYAEGHGEGSLFRRKNKIFKELALEAVRSRPRDYLILSLRGARNLWRDGLTFWYDWQLIPLDPFPRVDEVWAGRRPAWFERRFSEYGRTWSAALNSDPGRRVERGSPTTTLPNLVTHVVTKWFRVIAWCAVLFALIAAISAGGVAPSGLRLQGLASCAALVLFYVVFCGFTIPAEPQRYLSHVQDLIVSIPMILIGVGLGEVAALARSEGLATGKEPKQMSR